LLAAAALAVPAAACAQEQVDPAAHTAATAQVYPADFFARFGPRNASEMLAQVPGFTIRNDAEGRGLGQASTNVLLNGARLTSKTDDIFTQLARIPASRVERIEVVDAATLDVPGLTGQVANIIATGEGGISGNYAWRIEGRPHFADPLLHRFDSALTGKAGKLEYTIGLSNLASRGAAGGETRITSGTGELIETRDDVLKVSFDQPKLSLAAKLDTGKGTVINLNSSYRLIYYRSRQNETRDLVVGVDRDRVFREKDYGRDFELGGDVAFKLGPGQLKLIGLNHAKHEPFEYTSIFTYADESPATGDRFTETFDISEQVARAEYGWKMGGADWQLSAEAAFNRLDSKAALFTLSPAGEFEPVPFPGANSGVKEARYESILSYSRPLSSRLSLQLNGGWEFSRLTQLGGEGLQREFRRPKGSLSLAWAPAKGIDVSFKARRRVGQLDFIDFLSRVFLDSDNENAGNNQLVPPQSWEFEIEAKKDLGKWGNTTLRLYDYRIEDLVDIVPIGLDGESPGNIPNARRYGFEWTSTLLLDELGIKGGKLDASVQLEGSRLKDPLTGTNRPISNTEDRSIEINFRHDIPRSKLAWGFGLNNLHIQNYYRLGETGLGWEGPTWFDVFVEHKDVAGLTVRLAAFNLLNARNKFDRVVHTGWRDRTPIDFIENRDRLIGPIFSLRVSGNF
jgi:hypothetical protein